MRVIIRADGNKTVAMGHIMRCLSIADALRMLGIQVCFVTAGEETKELLGARGYKNKVLGTAFDRMEEELPALEAVLREQKPDMILVDSYYITPAYMKRLGAFARMAYLDDMGLVAYPVDLLINYNIYGEASVYAELYREAREKLPKLLLGCDFAPLRREFLQRKAVRGYEKAKNVLITTGGGDLFGAGYALCERLAEQIAAGFHKGVSYHVVVGPFSEQKKELLALAEQYPAFVLHENVTQMSELMQKCDVAVSAAGSTMYELCCMGLPTVCFYFAENQRRMAECFAKRTEIWNAGNFAKEKDVVLTRLLERLLELETNETLRNRIGTQAVQLVDGKGAARLAERMEAWLKGNPA